MSWKPPSIEITHPMYQPRRRAKRAATRTPAESDPRSQGSREERQAWMRERQQARRANRQTGPSSAVSLAHHDNEVLFWID